MADKRIVTVDYLNSEGLNKDYINNTFANALKGSKSDTAMLLDDVSPVPHEMGVKVRGKNLFDKDTSFTDDNKVTDGAATGYLTYFIQLQPNTQYYAKCFAPVTTDVTVTILSSNKAVNSDVSKGIVLSRQLAGWKTELALTTDDTGRLYVGNNANNLDKIKEILSACNLQIELGTTATDYEPYQGQTYTPTATGEVTGIEVLNPTTNITNDKGLLFTKVTGDDFNYIN